MGVDYQNGKIYKIKHIDESGMEYIGSTTQSLKHRLMKHKMQSRYDECLKYNWINYFGWNNFVIELIEDYPCNNKLELIQREQYWFEMLKPILNDKYAFGANTERYKQSRIKNKIEEYQKNYRKKHKDESFVCNCKGKYTRYNKSNHEMTKKHINYLNSLK